MIYFAKALASIAVWAAFVFVCQKLPEPFTVCFVAVVCAIATNCIWDSTTYYVSDPDDDDDGFDNDDDDEDEEIEPPDPLGDITVDDLDDDEERDDDEPVGKDPIHEAEKRTNRIDKFSLN